MRIKPQERSLKDLNPEYQDPHILVIPGGLGAWKLCRSLDALHYVHKCRNQDGWVAASCAGALVLKQAALTGMGRFSEKNRLTGCPEIRQEMIDGGWDFVDNERIVVDDRVITSAG